MEDDLRPEYDFSQLQVVTTVNRLTRLLNKHADAIMASPGVTGCSVGLTETGEIKIKIRGTAFDVDYIRSLVGENIEFEKDAEVVPQPLGG